MAMSVAASGTRAVIRAIGMTTPFAAALRENLRENHTHLRESHTHLRESHMHLREIGEGAYGK